MPAGDGDELGLPGHLAGLAEAHRPGGDVLLVERVGHRAVRAARPERVRLPEVPLLVLPVEEQQLAVLEHVRVAVEVLVVAQRVDA